MGITSLDQAIARSQRSGVDLTVLMIDLDQFKKLNDTYGHVQGDQALRATADVLRKTLRRSDTICRYGGEEFMVVLPETSAEESAVLAARLFTAVEARGHDEKLPITVSIGQASVRQDDSAESLLNRADLVVIDFHMPGQDGPSMLRALRAAATNLPSPPLMYLHTTDSEQAANYKQLGFDGVIGMKGNFELLTKQVNAAMRLRRLSVKIRIG
jgi:diguanylate cyclase (GGDEF)-like protein